MSQEAQVVKWNCPCGNSYKFHGFTEAKPQRQWVGLTEEEKKEFIWMFDESKGGLFKHFKYMEAIEAKLKSKNGFDSTEKNQ